VLPQLLLAFGVLAVAGCTDANADAAAPSASGGAGGEAAHGQAGDPASGLRVEVGTPGGEDDLDFTPLANGAELRLQTFGQGGTHVLIGVRCTGFGSRAFVSAKLLNLVTGLEVAEPPPARPQLLYCTGNEGGEDPRVCELVPYLVHASGISESEDERHGLRVRITASVESEAGDKAEGSVEAVLSAADL
jgi:hypothetical protein